MKAILDIVREHKAGHSAGIYSVCSAHPVVIEAALREALARGEPVLIEATSNQVNQFGGYTGMVPADFREYVAGIAQRVSFPMERLLLGGDHLGPNTWTEEPAPLAMQRAGEMIAGYVKAGFRKIHLDCSMSCAGDPTPLEDSVVAARAADLCAISEKVWREVGGEAPVYVIGTEVPVPGGAAEDLGTLAVTSPAAVGVTLEAHRSAFAGKGLQGVWRRVVGLVVQPGVEFDHHKVIDYDRDEARLLSQRIVSEPNLVFEAHSTDYQKPAGLRALVEDHFAILKVGPAVTFALRETLWTFSEIARELQRVEGETLKEIVLRVMQGNPRYWKSYYNRSGPADIRSAVQSERPDPVLLDCSGGQAGVCHTHGAPVGRHIAIDPPESVPSHSICGHSRRSARQRSAGHSARRRSSRAASVRASLQARH